VTERAILNYLDRESPVNQGGEMSDERIISTARARVHLADARAAADLCALGAARQHYVSVAGALEVWAIPIAEERDRLAARLEQVEREIINMQEPAAWWDYATDDRRIGCPFCGEVSEDNQMMPHKEGCPWWELVPASGGAS